jgi:hypothetical protein
MKFIYCVWGLKGYMVIEEVHGSEAAYAESTN